MIGFILNIEYICHLYNILPTDSQNLGRLNTVDYLRSEKIVSLCIFCSTHF